MWRIYYSIEIDAKLLLGFKKPLYFAGPPSLLFGRDKGTILFKKYTSYRTALNAGIPLQREFQSISKKQVQMVIGAIVLDLHANPEGGLSDPIPVPENPIKPWNETEWIDDGDYGTGTSVGQLDYIPLPQMLRDLHNANTPSGVDGITLDPDFTESP